MLWVFQTSLLEGAQPVPQGQCIELLCQHNQSLRKPLKLVATVAVVVEASLVTLTITGNQVCTFGSGCALPYRGAFKTWIYIWITSSISCSCCLLSLTSFIILSTFSFARLSRFTIGTSAPGCQPKDRSQRIFPTTTWLDGTICQIDSIGTTLPPGAKAHVKKWEWGCCANFPNRRKSGKISGQKMDNFEGTWGRESRVTISKLFCLLWFSLNKIHNNTPKGYHVITRRDLCHPPTYSPSPSPPPHHNHHHHHPELESLNWLL